MESAPLPSNESERLKSLEEHQILDTLPEEVYDDITNIASQICGTPIALITLVDKERQWFKSKLGLDATETSRQTSFCAHAILQPDEAFIVPDARYDERFFDNPVTTGDDKVIFYAGIPFKDENGLALGSLCVIDNRPRELSDQTIKALKALGKLVSAHIQLRKALIENGNLKVKLNIAKSSALTINQEAEELQKKSEYKDNAQVEAIINASASIKGLDK